MTLVPGQGAAVFLSKGSRIDPITFEAAVLEHRSTSKSSLLLAGLDAGRWDMAMNGERRIADAIAEIQAGEQLLVDADLGHLLVDWSNVPHVHFHVPYRVVIRTVDTGYTGFELRELLEERGIQVAQASIGFLVLGFGLGAVESIRPVFEILRAVVQGLEARQPLGEIVRPPFREHEVDFHAVRGMKREVVPLDRAVGRLAGDFVGIYPPGAALMIRGSEITDDVVDYMQRLIGHNGVRYGLSNRVRSSHITVLRD